MGYNGYGKKGRSKRQILRRVEEKTQYCINQFDTIEENNAVLQYAKDNGVTLYDMSQELKMSMDKIRHQFSYNMTPERIMKYCRAVDRIKEKKESV